MSASVAHQLLTLQLPFPLKVTQSSNLPFLDKHLHWVQQLFSPLELPTGHTSTNAHSNSWTQTSWSSSSTQPLDTWPTTSLTQSTSKHGLALPRILQSTFQVHHLNKRSIPPMLKFFSLPTLLIVLLRVKVHSNGLQLPPLAHFHLSSKLSSMVFSLEEPWASNSVHSNQPPLQKLTLDSSTDQLPTMKIFPSNLLPMVLLTHQRPMLFKSRTLKLSSTKNNTTSSLTQPRTLSSQQETSQLSMELSWLFQSTSSQEPLRTSTRADQHQLSSQPTQPITLLIEL